MGMATAGLHVQMHVTGRFDVHTCMNMQFNIYCVCTAEINGLEMTTFARDYPEDTGTVIFGDC